MQLVKVERQKTVAFFNWKNRETVFIPNPIYNFFYGQKIRFSMVPGRIPDAFSFLLLFAFATGGGRTGWGLKPGGDDSNHE